MSVPVIFSGYISLTWSATLFTILTKGDIVFSPILLSISFSFFFFFFFNDTATTEIYTLSLHDALPIYALAAVLLHDLVFDAREDLDVDDDAFHPRRHLQRRVLHVLRLLAEDRGEQLFLDRKSTRLNSSHLGISYAVFCLKKKTNTTTSACSRISTFWSCPSMLPSSGAYKPLSSFIPVALPTRFCRG